MKKFFCLSLIVFMTACSLAPDYHTPEMPVDPAYKESGDWIQAQPLDTGDRGDWWKMFHDPWLDTLEDQVTAANQSLKAAVAQYDQARATAAQARSAYFPTITGDAGGRRLHNSRDVANRSTISQYNDFTMGADLTYEVDLWGRVRNTVAANEDQAEASAADLAGVILSLHAELANDYIALRGADAAQEILEQTVDADQKAYDLTKRRYDGGVSAEVDLDQAATQLENGKTDATDKRLQRAQLEHAIAIMIGKAPAEFTLAPGPLVGQIPFVEPGLPSTLLQRRPDIAASERRVAAANAEIGVARAAWFPVFSLAGTLGFESASPMSWMNAPSHFWSLGSSAMMPLFTGGAIDALNEVARAAYEQSVANYRQTVLTAYQDVEDNLVEMHRLNEETKTQDAATIAAQRALMQAQNRYKDGITTFIDVAVAQNTELQARLAQITIFTRRLSASVQLIKALGGGWTNTEMVRAEESK